MIFVARLLVLVVPVWSCGSLCNLSESDVEGLVQIHALGLLDDPDYSRRSDRLHRRLHRRQSCLDTKQVASFSGIPLRSGHWPDTLIFQTCLFSTYYLG